MKRRYLIAAALAVPFAALALAGSDKPVQTAYFKSPAADRVRAYQAAAPLTAADAEAFLRRALMATPGSVSAAFIYPPGARVPGDDLTGAASTGDALALVATQYPGWSWRLRVNPAGAATFDGQ